MDFGLIIKILYAAASLQGIFLGVLLLRSRDNRGRNQVLSLLLLLISFHLILVGFDERSFFMTFPHLSRVSWIIGTLYWPLLFLFIQKTLNYNFPRWVNFLLFLPFVMSLIIMAPYYLKDAAQKRMILENFEVASQADFGWVNQTVSLLHIFFQTLAVATYYRIERYVKDEFSGDETIRMQWLKEFLIGILLVTIVAVFSFFARNFNIPVLSNLYRFHFVGLVVLFYWVSYKALTNPSVFGLQVVESHEKKTSGTQAVLIPAPDQKLSAVFDSIKGLLEKEKLYLKPTLTLTELAERAGVPRNVASRAINAHSGGNFFELINEFRVAEFKQLVQDPTKKNLSLLGISQESGFNSKATFYSIFKKKTGMTPSEFVESQSKQS